VSRFRYSCPFCWLFALVLNSEPKGTGNCMILVWLWI